MVEFDLSHFLKEKNNEDVPDHPMEEDGSVAKEREIKQRKQNNYPDHGLRKSFFVCFVVHPKNKSDAGYYYAELKLFEKQGKPICNGEYRLLLTYYSSSIPSSSVHSHSIHLGNHGPNSNPSIDIYQDHQPIENDYLLERERIMLHVNLEWLPKQNDPSGKSSVIFGSKQGLSNVVLHPGRTIPSGANSNLGATISRESHVRVIYEFFLPTAGGIMSRVSRECREDLVCPWCFVLCAQFQSLITHLNHSHSRFLFTSIVDDPVNDKYTIEVCINKNHSDADYFVKRIGDEQYVCKEFTFVRHYVPFLGGKRKPGSELIRHMSMNGMGGSHGSIITNSGNKIMRASEKERTYFHSKTYVPIRADEKVYDSDDDDTDMHWFHARTEALIDDFTDVNNGEKEIMKLWNRHISTYYMIADRYLSVCCVEFAQRYGAEILKKNVRHNFTLHLMNLFNMNLITHDCIRLCLETIDFYHHTTVANKPLATSSSTLSSISTSSSPQSSNSLPIPSTSVAPISETNNGNTNNLIPKINMNMNLNIGLNLNTNLNTDMDLDIQNENANFGTDTELNNKIA